MIFISLILGKWLPSSLDDSSAHLQGFDSCFLNCTDLLGVWTLMDMMEDDCTLSLSTKSEIGTFALEEINGSADNELRKLTSMMPLPPFDRT